MARSIFLFIRFVKSKFSGNVLLSIVDKDMDILRYLTYFFTKVYIRLYEQEIQAFTWMLDKPV